MLRVTCAIVLHEKKILVTQRGPAMLQPGKWEFPGGKIEDGETDEECMLRELQEELNISVELIVKLKDCVHDYGDFQITLIPFLANYESGTLTLSEHMNYQWLNPDQLNTLDWAPADVEVVEEVLKLIKGS